MYFLNPVQLLVILLNKLPSDPLGKNKQTKDQTKKTTFKKGFQKAVKKSPTKMALYPPRLTHGKLSSRVELVVDFSTKK